jgi:hypothetical protein
VKGGDYWTRGSDRVVVELRGVYWVVGVLRMVFWLLGLWIDPFLSLLDFCWGVIDRYKGLSVIAIGRDHVARSWSPNLNDATFKFSIRYNDVSFSTLPSPPGSDELKPHMFATIPDKHSSAWTPSFSNSGPRSAEWRGTPRIRSLVM